MSITISGTYGLQNMPSTAAPAFAAYQNVGQGLSSGVWTKLRLDTEEFDTSNCFDSTTNYRFTPTVAGYYQVNGCFNQNNNAQAIIEIAKNGTEFKRGGFASGTSMLGNSVSNIVYLNGTTDYIEFYVYSGGTTATITANFAYTYASACLVRAA